MAKPDMGHYKNALERAKRDLNEALDEQENIEQRADELRDEIVNLRRIVSSLSDLCGVPVDNVIGITEAVTEAMAATPRPLTTKEVTQLMEELGFNLSSQKNAVASVGAILNRLNLRGMVLKRATDAATLWEGPKAIGKSPNDPDGSKLRELAEGLKDRLGASTGGKD